MDYRHLLEEVYQEVLSLDLKGTIATYIPELANVDESKFGISLITTQGAVFSVGNTEEKFSIQSISKVFALAVVYPILKESLWERVGVEPSGNPFNSLIRLENENGVPRNPLINSGALVITDCLREIFENPIDTVLEFIRKVSNTPDIDYCEATAQSELTHSSRNKALAYFIKSYGNIKSDVEELIESYSYQCSIEMTCTELARAFLLFANTGVNFYTNEELLTKSQSKRINAIMQTCGFYDEAGDFAFKVGLPGKSGVGGGIAAVLPGKFSVVVWSPLLNEKGNSTKGMKALELLTTKLGYSVF
ncbi:MAG: glutaminase [Salinivirgaceae bacterium]|jgi:glutaminase|nr:glutaminase [Salinivirgaceae bacterium]